MLIKIKKIVQKVKCFYVFFKQRPGTLPMRKGRKVMLRIIILEEKIGGQALHYHIFPEKCVNARPDPFCGYLFSINS